MDRFYAICIDNKFIVNKFIINNGDKYILEFKKGNRNGSIGVDDTYHIYDLNGVYKTFIYHSLFDKSFITLGEYREKILEEILNG